MDKAANKSINEAFDVGLEPRLLYQLEISIDQAENNKAVMPYFLLSMLKRHRNVYVEQKEVRRHKSDDRLALRERK